MLMVVISKMKNGDVLFDYLGEKFVVTNTSEDFEKEILKVLEYVGYEVPNNDILMAIKMINKLVSMGLVKTRIM